MPMGIIFYKIPLPLNNVHLRHIRITGDQGINVRILLKCMVTKQVWCKDVVLFRLAQDKVQ
jgi:hypothetical protein